MLENHLTVKIKPGAGLPAEFVDGMIVGVMTTEIPVLGRFYAVDVGRLISDVYPYQVVMIAENQLTQNST